MVAAKKPTLFLRACRGEVTDRIPAWLMRQAGRYLPAYQALRGHATFLEMCNKPELATQATLDAAKYLGTDAAIIFSDITLPGHAMGLPLEFEPGPKFKRAVRTRRDVEALTDIDPNKQLGFVMEAVKKTRAALPSDVSLIGFVGAPLTLAAYMIEGEPTRNWIELKRLVYGDRTVAEALLERVTKAVVAHAKAQLDAGCDSVQLFDSHAGELAEHELLDFGFAFAKEAITALKRSGAPVIYFARGIGAHLEAAAGLGADVLGLDWTVSVAAARKRLGKKPPALMGNLDPTVLFTSRGEIDTRVRAILAEAKGHPGFIFNLGHGVLPGTPPEHALQVIESVHAWKP